MSESVIFIIQLVGIILAGGFIGEFHRTIHTSEFTPSLFIANFLAGSFLTFILSSLFYMTTNKRNVTIILGGLLSYQDHEFISKIAKGTVEDVLKNSNKKGEKDSD
jgi:hypothetical protein